MNTVRRAKSSSSVRRLTLHAVAEEQKILGAMMISEEQCDLALRACTEILFVDTLHRRIFTTAAELRKMKQRVSALTIKARMADDPGLRDLAAEPVLHNHGGDYLKLLCSVASGLPDVQKWISVLKEVELRRAALIARGFGDEIERSEAGPRFAIKSAASLGSEVARDYLLKGLLSPGDLVVIYGESASGKTFLATYKGWRISQGRTVFECRVHRATVLYVALEGETGFERRVRALASREGPSEQFFWIGGPANLYSDRDDVEGVIAAAHEVDARLIIIDTLFRAMGEGAENESRDMAMFIAEIDAIRRATGAAVVLVHHTGKDVSRGMRGHSSLLAAADVALEISRDKEAGTRSLRVVKAKDDRDGSEYGFALDVVELGKDEDGDAITSCVARETGAISKAVRTDLSSGQVGWLKDLRAVFGEPGVGGMNFPVSGMTQQFCLTREEVREGFKKRGRFTLNPDGTLTGGDREKMRTALNHLKDKGKIGMTDKYVWLLKERQ